jgi:magnesium transporter
MELLEDVIIENKQAIEMGKYIQGYTLRYHGRFCSVISNNLNIVMKLLASITILLSVPTLIASLWGMNVPVPFTEHPHGFLIVMMISVVITAVAFFILWRKRMF